MEYFYRTADKFKSKARTTVFEDSLDEFRILFVLRFDFCHKRLILCLYAKLVRTYNSQKSPYTTINN